MSTMPLLMHGHQLIVATVPLESGLRTAFRVLFLMLNFTLHASKSRIRPVCRQRA